MKWLGLLVIFTGLQWGGAVYGEPTQPAQFPSLASTLNGIDGLSFCGEEVPMDVQEVRERLEKQILLTLWRRSQAVLWLKRSGRYFPHIEKSLKEQRLPPDLKYVAVAESDLRPHAVSNKGAVGFWQFIPSTGRKYGLTINKNIDKRRNFFASTEAALRYLDALHNMMGSWTLAVAAYNMGEERLAAEIVEQGSKDYYRLYLPFETQQFIFRVLAIKLIFLQPEKYGFFLADEEYYRPLEFDTIRLHCVQKTPLRLVADAANTYFKVIKDLNPEIRGRHLYAGRYGIRIPKGAKVGFQIRFQRLMSELQAVTYVVEQGDNLSLIAKRFDVPLSSILMWNRLDIRQPIQPGDKLIVYSGTRISNHDEPVVEEMAPNEHASHLEEPSNENDSSTHLPAQDEIEIDL